MPRSHVLLADHGHLTITVDASGADVQLTLRTALTAAARTTANPNLPVLLEDPNGMSGYVRGVDVRGVEAAERVLRKAGWDVERSLP